MTPLTVTSAFCAATISPRPSEAAPPPGVIEIDDALPVWRAVMRSRPFVVVASTEPFLSLMRLATSAMVCPAVTSMRIATPPETMS